MFGTSMLNKFTVERERDVNLFNIDVPNMFQAIYQMAAIRVDQYMKPRLPSAVNPV